MLTKPSVHALRSLYALSQSKGWDEVNKLFENELRKSYDFLVESRDELALRQMQGRVQFIREFQDMVREAPRLLEKLKDSGL
jgi:hypothetical protein